MNNDATASHQTRLETTWRSALASLVALALIANGFMIWRTDARLQARIDAIRAAGDPATIADLAPEPIPADQNAAAISRASSRRGWTNSLKIMAHFLRQDARWASLRRRPPSDEAPTAEQLAAIRRSSTNTRISRRARRRGGLRAVCVAHRLLRESSRAARRSRSTACRRSERRRGLSTGGWKCSSAMASADAGRPAGNPSACNWRDSTTPSRCWSTIWSASRCA